MDRISAFVKSFPTLIFSWRSLAILFLLFNFKSLPGMWTCRVFYQLVISHRREKVRLRKEAKGKRPLRAIVQKSTALDPISQHPLFTSETITTHAPLLEIDYNIHKSNSTYFSDLDVSRSKLMGRLTAPVWPLDRVPLEIDPTKAGSKSGTSAAQRGIPSVILGAVHTSFKREIPAYTPYKVQSRLLAWDSRWIYIGTWFYTTKPLKHGAGGSNPEVTLLASGLSKYIIKKGRITVRPETMFRVAGWLPDSLAQPSPSSSSSSSSAAAAPPPSSATPVTENSTESAQQQGSALDALSTATQEAAVKINEATITANGQPHQSEPTESKLQWRAEEIEAERRRCLDLLERSGWNHLDAALESEFRI